MQLKQDHRTLSKTSAQRRSKRWLRVPADTTWMVLHPYSRKRILWIVLGFTFMGFDLFCLTMDQFELVGARYKDAVALAGCAYWSLDMVLSFLTGTFVNSQLELRVKVVAKSYLRSWFFFDFFVVSVQWVTEPLSDRALSGRAGALRWLRVARYLRLLRLVKLDEQLTLLLGGSNSVWMVLMVRCGQYVVLILLWVHTSGCAWYALGAVSEDGWAFQRESLQTFPTNYLVAVHWASSNLQGNVDVGPGDVPTERIFAICHILISLLVVASLVGKLTNLMEFMEEVTANMNRQTKAAREYCMQNRISTELSVRVQKWLEWHQILDAKRQRSAEDNEFMHVLPAEVRRALIEETRSPLLLHHELFHACRDCNVRFFQRLATDTFVPLNHIPEETIFTYGMVCTRMYFIAAGRSTYFKYGAILRSLTHSGVNLHGQVVASDTQHHYRKFRSINLREGRALCEPVLFTHWVHMGDFASVTSLSMLVLEHQGFEELLMSYPNVRQALQVHANRFIAALNASTDPSDLFSSSSALD